MSEYDALLASGGKDANEYDALIQTEADEGRQRLRASLYPALRQNPDEYAQAKQLAEQIGLPAPVVARNLPDVQRRAQLNEYDTLLDTSPALAGRLQNPDFAKVAHDDIAALANIETRIKQFGELKAPEQPEVSIGSITSGFIGAFKHGAEQVRQGLRQQFADAIGSEAMSADASRKYQQEVARQEAETPAFESSTASGLYSGGVSVAQQIPGLAASIATRSPAPSLAAAGLLTESQAYAKYRARGATPGESALGAYGEGATEVLTELLPMSYLVGQLGKVGFGEFMAGLLARELPGEQIATLVQDAVDTATANPDKTWGEYLKERPDAAYQTLLATLVASGVFGGAHVAAGAVERRLKAADRNAEALQKLDELAKASKLRERDPASFAQFVEEAAKDGPVQDIYVDAETLAQTLNQAGVDPRQLAQQVPSLTAQLDEALAVKGDVRIPLGEYAAGLAGSKVSSALLPHLRTSPEAMSQTEAREFMRSQAEVFKQQAEKILEDHKFDTAWRESAASVEKELLAQLRQANRFTDDVNAQYARLMGSFYVTQASHLGVTPEEMYVKYPLRIQAESPLVGGTLEQSGEFDDLIKKLRAIQPQQEAAAKTIDEIVQKQRALEGLRAAVRDPKTGKTYTGWSHQQAIDSAPKWKLGEDLHDTVWSRLSNEWDKSTDNVGFINPAGKFISRSEAEKKWGVLTMEDVKDAKKKLYQAGTKVLYQTDKVSKTLIVRTKAFKKWFGKSKVVDESGKPLVVYHGTTADFIEFDRDRGNVESDFGAGIYFTNTQTDVSENYGGFGPDLTQKIELRAEQIQGESEDTDEPVGMDEARKIARDEFAAHEGMVMPVYLKIVNPFELGGENETRLTYEAVTDEEGEYTGDEKGTLVDFILNLRNIALRYDDGDVSAVIEELLNQGMDGDISASQVDKIIKDDEEFGYYTDDSGKLVNREVYRQALEATGFDGVIDRTVDEKFGSQRRVGRAMEGMTPSTVHYVVFEPTQIKSAIGNRGTFLPENANILYQDAPVVTLTGQELGDLGDDIGAWRTAGLEAYRALQHGEPAQHPVLGEVSFTGAGRKKLSHIGASIVKWQMVPALREIIERATVASSEQATGRTDGIVAFHWLKSVVAVGDKVYEVGVHVAEDARGNKFYNLNQDLAEWRQKYETPKGAQQIKAGAQGSEGGPEGTTLDQSLAPDGDSINLQILQQQGQGGNRGSITFGTDLRQTPSVITLLQNADLSTFLHESGHFYLEVLSDIASQSDAPAEVVEDMSKLLKWFGVQDLATWRAMPLEQKRPYHEQLARGFEAYLFEGKAPSIELSSVFAKLRAWLLNVYRSLLSLNVSLTDEVRGVFNRMLATNEQIMAAEAARSYAPLFKTAEEMGATAEEWKEYQALDPTATQEAVDQLQARGLRDMRWLANVHTRKLKELQREAGAKRAAVQREVTAEVRAEPVYAAMRYLARGELATGERVETPVKLSLPALKEMYGEAADAPWRSLSVGRYGIAAVEGMHHDEVAPLFGFTSGDELVRKMIAAEPERSVIEGLTDRRMLERYGDLATPAALERATNEAIHNEARAKFVATELRALAKATGQRKILVQAAKEFAERIIARKRIRDIRPAQYEAAEARAARSAEKALVKGNRVEAATEKRNQLVNNYAARAAYAAENSVEQGVRYLKRSATEGARKGLDADYLDQIDALLERFDLRSGQSLKSIDKRKALAAWIEAQEEQGLTPAIPEELRNEAFRKHYRDLTVEEFSGLVDAVKNIAHLGRLKKKLLTAKDQREFEAVVEAMVVSIEDNAKGAVKERRTSDRGVLVSTGAIFRNFLAEHRKFASLARELDGWKDAGAVWEYLVRNMNAAGDFEAVEREKATIKLAELLDPIFTKEGRLELLKRRAEQAKRGDLAQATANTLGQKTYFPAIGKSFTYEERLGIALNMGNEVNRERVLTGERLAPEQLQTVLDTLTKEDWDFVQGVWDYLDTFREPIAAKERRLTGLEPEWVEATPVQTRFGEYRGGYYPIKYDVLRSSKAEADTAAEVQRQIERGLYTRAQTRRGHLKARTESTGRPLRYDLNVIVEHVDQAIHDLAWHEYLIDANRLLRNKTLDAAIREHYGPEKLRTMKDTLRDIAIGDLGAQTTGDRILNHLRHGATIAGLGWRVTTSLLQPLGLTQSMVRIGPKWVLKGARHWLGDAVQLENSANTIYEKSEFMRLRAKTLQREINEIRNKVSGKDSRLEATYFYLIQKMQLVADIPTWFGAYEKAMSEADMTEDKAVALADQAVIDAQGGGQIKDLSQVQRGSAAWKLFTTFYSFFNTTYNLTVEAVGRTDFKRPASVGFLAVDMALLYTIPALLSTLMKATLGGDWDDERKLLRQLVADQLNYLLGTVVLVRELAAAVQSAAGLHGDYTGPASVRVFSEAARLAKQIEQGEADEAFWKSLNNTAGIVFHYPAGQINSTASGIAALYRGETENPGVLLVGHKR